MDNHSTSLCCEHCGRTDVVELHTIFGIVLCPDCGEQFKSDLETLITKYKRMTHE